MKKQNLKQKRQQLFKKEYLIALGVLVFIIAVAAVVLNIDKITKSVGKDVVAVVNGQSITQKDIDDIWTTLPENVKTTTSKDSIKELLVNQSIMEAVVLQEAAKKGISASDQEVSDLITTVSERANMSQAQLNDFLSQQGLSMEFLKNTYKKQLIVLKVLNETANSIVVSDAEVEKFYNDYNYFFIDADNQTMPLTDVKEQIKAKLVQDKVQEYVDGLVATATIVRK